jgi:hypothetical protein
VGPTVGLDACEKSRLHRDAIPGPSRFIYKIKWLEIFVSVRMLTKIFKRILTPILAF